MRNLKSLNCQHTKGSGSKISRETKKFLRNWGSEKESQTAIVGKAEAAEVKQQAAQRESTQV